MSMRRRRAAAIVLSLGIAAYASTALVDNNKPLQHASQPPELLAAASETGRQHDPSRSSFDDAAITRQEPADKVSAEQTGSGGFQYQSNGVPAGFEAWFEPQKIALDIFYGGRYLLTTLAEFDGKEVSFLSPDEVANSIPGALDPAAITGLLSQPLAPNSDRLCMQANQPLCGRLETKTVGIIFDETRIRADLFVNRSLLAKVAEADPRYLPEGDKERVTLVQNLNSLYTSDNNGYDRFSLFGKTRAGNNGHYGFSDWVSTNDQDLSVDQIGYRHDLRDHIVTVGLFEPSLDMLRGMGRDLLVGAGIEKSMKRRTDLDSIISTPIDVFLPVRSRVDIFRDGRLISSGFYEAGNQRIDTSRLPSGSYIIELVTTDAGGNISTEQQLFVKSTLLAPPGEAIWFAEGGKVSRRAPFETFPDELDVNIVRGGYRWREKSWLGFGLAGAATEDAALAEVSASMLFDWLEAGAELYQSTEGGRGAGVNAVTRRGSHTLTISSRSSSADDLPPPSEPQYRLIEEDRWQHTAQWITRVNPNANLSLSSSYSGGKDLPNSRRSTARYNHYFPASAGNAFSVTAELGEVDGDVRFMLGAQWRAVGRHWTHTAGIDVSGSDIPDDQDGVSASVSSRWRDQDLLTDELDAGISAQANDSTQGVTADVRHGSQWGNGQLAASHTRGDQFEQTQYLASYDTSIVVGESYRPAVGGGPRSGEAGVILDLGDASGSVVDIYADGQRQFSARGGRRVPVTLMPYREYQISLIDRGTSLVSFDNEPRRIVLYPGDVDTLSWSMQKINIIVGRLQRQEEFCSEVTGECYSLKLPLPDTRVEGLEGFVFTDKDGFFQGEVVEGTSELQARYNGINCTINIADLPVTEGVIRAPALVCNSGSGDDIKQEQSKDN
mgnify:FL=1